MTASFTRVDKSLPEKPFVWATRCCVQGQRCGLRVKGSTRAGTEVRLLACLLACRRAWLQAWWRKLRTRSRKLRTHSRKQEEEDLHFGVGNHRRRVHLGHADFEQPLSRPRVRQRNVYSTRTFGVKSAKRGLRIWQKSPTNEQKRPTSEQKRPTHVVCAHTGPGLREVQVCRCAGMQACTRAATCMHALKTRRAA